METSLFAILSFVFTFSYLISSVAGLWPIPLSYQHGVGVVWIANDVAFSYSIADQKQQATNSSSPNASTTSLTLNTAASYAIVEAAIQRTQERLVKDNFVPWKFHPRNSNFEPSTNASRTNITRVLIQQNETDSAAILKPKAGEVSERYTLFISASGAVEITAISSIGILRALETFTQLFYKHSTPSSTNPSSRTAG
ncbi:MAG: hypothetical protein Q9174_006150 [Haloplaca sp. 1 TL-2023]